jgi:hypothetical protein
MGRERYVATRFCRVGYDCVARFFNRLREYLAFFYTSSLFTLDWLFFFFLQRGVVFFVAFSDFL